MTCPRLVGHGRTAWPQLGWAFYQHYTSVRTLLSEYKEVSTCLDCLASTDFLAAVYCVAAIIAFDVLRRSSGHDGGKKGNEVGKLHIDDCIRIIVEARVI